MHLSKKWITIYFVSSFFFFIHVYFFISVMLA